MRVLFLTSTLPRYPGDMQANFVGEQAVAWKAERPDDQLTILAPHDAGAAARETLDGIEIVRFRYFVPPRWQMLAYPAILPNLKRRPWLAGQILPFLIAQYRAARRLIVEKDIDLIYAHWVMPQGLVTYLLSRRLNIPYVLQNHSSDIAVFGKLGSAGRSLARAIIERARMLFVVNSRQNDQALSLFPAGRRAGVAQKVAVLPMGVAAPPDLCPETPEYDLATISRLSRKKGIGYFIGAADQAARSGKSFRIAIAGDGEDSDYLKSLVKHADVEFVGFVTGKEKERFLAKTRVFVVPSMAAGNDVEGLPVALLEALCRGKPVIASPDSNITLLPEWEEIKPFVFLLKDPRDVDEFAAVMSAASASSQSLGSGVADQLRQRMSRYQWPNLIRTYHQKLGLPDEKAP